MDSTNETKVLGRVEYMDILKGLAIILVVMGHCSGKGENIIYLFHMPLFFIISGYFYKEESINRPIQFIKKRLKSLYLPFIKYEFLFLILHNIFIKINFYNSKANIPQQYYTIHDFIVNSIRILFFDSTELLLSPFWFLTALFLTSILFFLISIVITKVISNNKREPVRALLVIILFFVGNYLTKHSININFSLNGKETFNVSLVALLMYYIGFLYKKYEKFIKMNIVCAGITIIVLYISSKFSLRIDMRVNMYPNLIMFVVNSVLGTYFMIYISKKISTLNYKLKLLKYIGLNTTAIMALHLTSFKIIGLLEIKIYKLPMYMLGNFGAIQGGGQWWILYTLAGVMVPILIVFTIDKINHILFKRKIALSS
jgi:Fucose 4-O-acetylase and related acetyltransferases